MKKTYHTPDTALVHITTSSFIATSPGTPSATISNDEVDGSEIESRRTGFSLWADEEDDE